MKDYKYSKMAVVAAAILIVIDWFFNQSFGMIIIAMAIVPVIALIEWHKNSKLEGK